MMQHWFQIKYPDGVRSAWTRCPVMPSGPFAGSFYIPDWASDRGEITVYVTDRDLSEKAA